MSVPKNGKSILFFDINFAPSEIRAARAAGDALGLNLIVYPERTPQQQDGIEKEYRALVSQNEKVTACLRAGRDCTDLLRKAEEIQKRLESWIVQIKRIQDSDVEQIATDLEAKGVKISHVVFSGHSGGNGSFVGLFGVLTSLLFESTFRNHPALFDEVSSILLWGCYSGTLQSLHEVWQKKFPTVKGFIGYRNRAPLGIRESSGDFLKSYLFQESKFLSATSSKASHQAFRAVARVADLDGTAVKNEYFFAYDKVGKIADLLKICDEFDVKLLERYGCYDRGEPGCENPPAYHMGPLRTFYSFLQVNRHCEGALQAKHGFIPKPETVIRLIFLDNMKANFFKFYNSSFNIFANYVAQAGYSSEVSMASLASSTRAEDNIMIEKAASDSRRLGFSDQSYIDNPNWKSIAVVDRTILGLRLLFSLRMSMSEPCTPFSWIEPDAKERDMCHVSDLLAKTLSEKEERALTKQFFTAKQLRLTLNEDPWIEFSPYLPYPSTVKDLRRSKNDVLVWNIASLEESQSLTPVEQHRLQLYRKLQIEMPTLSDEAVVGQLIQGFDKVIAGNEQLMIEAKQAPYNEGALKMLQSSRDIFIEIRKLTAGLK